MTGTRSKVVTSMILASVGLALTGCANGSWTSLPKPLYAQQQTPPPYRKAADGTIIDNADVSLDAQGYRLGKNGARSGEVDVPAKTGDQASNPVTGYYISSIGAAASGSVMAPSVGAGIGVGSGPGAAYTTPSGDPTTLPPQLVPTPGGVPSPAPVPLQR